MKNATAKFFLNGVERLTVGSLPFPFDPQLGMMYHFPTLDSAVKNTFEISEIHLKPTLYLQISSMEIWFSISGVDAESVLREMQEVLKLVNLSYRKAG
ncbi:MAG: hypothetical protein Q7R93_05710 [bacterium]|nr:hypothetical protein [bacterium]